MKPFMKTVPCTISTLSPVHIGCGEDYYPTNYVIDGGFLHSFSEEALIEALTLNEKKELAQLAEIQTQDGLKKLQKFVYNKRKKLCNYASHSVPVSEQLEEFYQDRITNNGNNALDIARHAFNPYSQTPYFAGSSIKGAIRTALLNMVNNGKKLQDVLNSLNIKNQNGMTYIVKENKDLPKNEKVSDKLQKFLLGYKDIPDDPLRLLKVSDANYQHDLFGAEIRFSLNRKNWQSEFISTAAEKDIYKRLECLPAFRHHSFKFDITFLQGKYLFNIELIAKVCNDFFKPQLIKELVLLRNLKYANDAWLDGLEALLDGELGEALKNNQAFLLRIGQHGGAESNTLEGVRHIKIMQGKDKETKEKRPDKYLSKPTTIWLAGDNKDQQQNLLPFGWILVETGDICLTETQQFLKNQAKPAYQLSAQLKEQYQERAKRLVEEKLIKKAHEKQEKERLEKERLVKEKREQQEREYVERQHREQQAQIERAAKLATLSSEQRLIAELYEESQKSTTRNQPVGGTLYVKLTDLVKQADNWSNEDKQALFELGSGINKTLWNTNKNVKNRLKALQA